MTNENKKIVIVGDKRVGKSTLMKSWKLERFYEYPVFPGHANVIRTIKVNEKQIEVTVWETKGPNETENFNKFIYADAQAILMCYSVDSRPSLHNAINIWKPQCSKFSPQTPIILICTKMDIGDALISKIEGKAAAKKIEVSAFFECSSMTMLNVSEIFKAAIQLKKKGK